MVVVLGRKRTGGLIVIVAMRLDSHGQPGQQESVCLLAASRWGLVKASVSRWTIWRNISICMTRNPRKLYALDHGRKSGGLEGCMNKYIGLKTALYIDTEASV
jgi:hypothetical protein